ncbi:hypothetical protein Q4574_21085 [Aliiglaciecola sp. 3_MG-2023]|uniref:hypothetical protein n=1 Tax=Aliiglaciecola sp. 3_MG-2023 TaxID=3062644 RepID=UPI0026E2A060|nr:hypothetical protein [Aliiglaciecola sp. 3_MG-2023]MDO6695805.1 hypothetical protein [Aliiglaciecola sp. 3_MG-2023]
MLKNKRLCVLGNVTDVLLAIVFSCSLTFTVNAQENLPDKCIQLPERSSVCPNILYKRSPVDIPQFEIKEGEMLCICMADFKTLRIAASDDAGKVAQIIELTKVSVKLNIDEKTLLEVIRK